MNLKCIILGAPCSGKSILGRKISEYYNVKYISVSEILHEEINKKSKVGAQIDKCMRAGELVPDNLLFDLLRCYFSKNDFKYFILEGIPRDLNQVKFLDKLISDFMILNLKVTDKILFSRISDRMICEKCSKVYNLLYVKPKTEGVCDVCGGKLISRVDDDMLDFKHRLKVYKENVMNILVHYEKRKKLKNVNIISNNFEQNLNKCIRSINQFLKSEGD